MNVTKTAMSYAYGIRTQMPDFVNYGISFKEFCTVLSSYVKDLTKETVEFYLIGEVDTIENEDRIGLYFKNYEKVSDDAAHLLGGFDLCNTMPFNAFTSAMNLLFTNKIEDFSFDGECDEEDPRNVMYRKEEECFIFFKMDYRNFLKMGGIESYIPSN